MPETKVVTVDVAFDRPILGARIVDAVYKAVTLCNPPAQATGVMRTVGHDVVVGQTSPIAYKELRVSPSREVDVFNPSQRYTDVIITHDGWDMSVSAICPNEDDDEERRSLALDYYTRFGEALKQVLEVH